MQACVEGKARPTEYLYPWQKEARRVWQDQGAAAFVAKYAKAGRPIKAYLDAIAHVSRHPFQIFSNIFSQKHHSLYCIRWTRRTSDFLCSFP